MRPVSSSVLLAAGLVAAGLAVAAGCAPAPPLYASEAAPVTVDGDAGEWPRALRPVPREGGLTLGLRNTDDALYLVVVAGDGRQARRVSSGGLRVWIDPAGGTERVLGVGYPLPLPPNVARGGSVERRRFAERLDRVTVRRGDGPVQTFQLGRLDGLDAAAEWTDRALVVEMRVPLDGSSDLLGAVEGGAVGVGVELVDPSGVRAQARRGVSQRGGAEGEPAEVPTVTRWLRADLAR